MQSTVPTQVYVDQSLNQVRLSTSFPPSMALLVMSADLLITKCVCKNNCALYQHHGHKNVIKCPETKCNETQCGRVGSMRVPNEKIQKCAC
jgi:hypothetical protein